MAVPQSETPTATPVPDQILYSQGHGGSSLVGRCFYTEGHKLWYPTSPGSFHSLTRDFARIVWKTSRERSVNTAVGDIDGDGLREIVVGLGPGGLGSTQPSIMVVWKVYPIGLPNNRAVWFATKGVFSLNAKNPKYRNPHGALNVAVGNFVGDDLPMIAAAQGLGGNHQVRMLPIH